MSSIQAFYKAPNASVEDTILDDSSELGSRLLTKITFFMCMNAAVTVVRRTPRKQ